jgi:hypothetical protein
LLFDQWISPGQAPGRGLDHGEGANLASLALRDDEREQRAVGAANDVSRCAQQVSDVICLLLKPYALCVWTLSVAAPVHGQQTVLVAELTLLGPGVLAPGEAAMHHDNEIASVAPRGDVE